MCSHFIGWLAHGQLCRGATGGKPRWAAHSLQLLLCCYPLLATTCSFLLTISFLPCQDGYSVTPAVIEPVVIAVLSLWSPIISNLDPLSTDPYAGKMTLSYHQLLFMATPPAQIDTPVIEHHLYWSQLQCLLLLLGALQSGKS